MLLVVYFPASTTSDSLLVISELFALGGVSYVSILYLLFKIKSSSRFLFEKVFLLLVLLTVFYYLGTLLRLIVVAVNAADFVLVIRSMITTVAFVSS